MKVLSRVVYGLLLLAMFQSVHGEYRYKIRGPPPKPLPPRPPLSHFASKPFAQTQFFNTKNKWPILSAATSGHRIIPPMRGSHFQYHHTHPQLHQQYLWSGPIQSSVHGMPLSLHGSAPKFQFKGPTLLLGATPLPSWKGEGNVNHGFRAPVLKEQFLPSPPSEYQPPKVSLPQPPVITHIENAIDDDKGPIHTIPAPNLSPSSNPNHNHHTPVFPQTHVKVEHSHSYEVHEPSNDHAGRTPDGVPTYFAPDPDPSLPAPKIPATTDPHSVPSNGKTPHLPFQAPAVQILDSSGSVANSLSSQELFHLLHAPQQPLVDSYGVPLVQHQLQQHYQQQADFFPPPNFLKQQVPSEQVPDNLVVIKTDFNPDYQAFNYEEQYQGSSRQQDVYDESFQEQEGSENVPSVTVFRKSPESTLTSFQEELQTQKDFEAKTNSVIEEDAYYNNAAANPESDNNQDQENYEENANNENHDEDGYSASYYSQADGDNGAIATSYYTTLPNREAAETLATLAAAGSINSNLVHHITNGEKEDTAPTRGDTPIEEDYAEEEEESEDPPPQISKPVTFQTPKGNEAQETTRLSSEHRQRHPMIPPPQPQEEVKDDQEYVDYSEDLDQQGSEHDKGAKGHTESDNEQQPEEDAELSNTNLQFGARIRPKRNK